MNPLLRKAQSAWALAGSYLKGWRCREKIVVIESDDWGSIRTASRAAYDCLVAAGYPMHRSPFSLDALETEEDLDRLFEVLESVRDAQNRPACLTANMILANPDFPRIRQSDFTEYVYEPVAATLARLPGRAGVADRWADGLARRLFVPQLHAREHVRWWQWLADLRSGSEEALLAFDLEMCGVSYRVSKKQRGYYRPIYLDDDTLARYKVDLEPMVREGAALFEAQFGYRSRSAIAPNYCWTDRVERLWADLGVRYVQGAVFQRVGGQHRRRAHYLGQESLAGGWYLVRNCFLELAAQSDSREADRCLRQVARAFRWRMPAVIGTHRCNYVGSISAAHRDQGLAALARVLTGIVSRWPDVLFLSSPQLGRRVEGGDRRADEVDGGPLAGEDLQSGGRATNSEAG